MFGSSLPENARKTASADALTALWQFFASSRWAAMLMVMLALTALWFVFSTGMAEQAPAMPANVNESAPLGHTDSPTSITVGGNIDPYSSLWLRCLFGLFVFSLGVRLADRVGLLFRLNQNVPRILATYLDGRPAYRGPLPTSLSKAEICARLYPGPGPRLMARVWQTTEGDKPVLYADHLRLAIWSDFLLHLACVAILIGAFVTAEYGWREDQVVLAAGESRDLSRAPGYALELAPQAAGLQDDTSAPEEIALILKSPQGDSSEHRIAPFKPLLTSHFSVFYQTSGPALNISAKDRNGDPLLLQPFVRGRGLKAASVAAMKFGDDADEDYLFVPKLTLFLRVDRYESLSEEGYDTTVYLLRGYQGNQPAAAFSRYIQNEGSFQWNDITFEVHPAPYVLVNVANDFGWWFVLVGLASVVIAGLARLWAGPLWLARFEAEGTTEPLGFVQLVLWPGKGPAGSDARTIRNVLQCMGASDGEP